MPELARRAGVRPAVAQGALYRMMVDDTAEIIPRGSVVDVRLKTPTLDAQSRRNIAARLKSRSSAAYAQIRDVETYAGLTTCRRERLLRHFRRRRAGRPVRRVRRVPRRDRGHAASRTRCGFPRTHPARVPNGTPVATDRALFERLKRWRGEQAKRQQVPAYVVLHNSHLEEIADRKPRTVHELGSIKGIGLRRAARYGEDLLALVRGEAPAAPAEVSSHPDYQSHLDAAERLLRSGRGADAIPSSLAPSTSAGRKRGRQ